MIEIKRTGKDLPQAYHRALEALHSWGKITPCSDWGTSQKEISLTMLVREPLREPMISKCFIGGPRELEQYRQEMLDGILDFEVERGKWAYTYHQRMADQIDFVIAELKRNADSRRAVISIREKEADMGSADPACLQHIQYFIRGGKLHSKVLFRSNDACKAAFMNAFALIMLQKRIADAVGCDMGTYTHRANSFHCYERDFPLLESYVKRMYSSEPITYGYVGEWDELMEEAKPDIAAMVRKLRENK